jgi:hypothetical protein
MNKEMQMTQPKRYNLFRGTLHDGGMNIEETLLSDFTLDLLFASSIPANLFDTTIRVIKWLDGELGATSAEFVLDDVSFIIAKTN